MTESPTPAPPSGLPDPVASPPRQGGLVGFLRRYDTWWSVLLVLFCVTAACGLPVLWASRAFRPPGKVFWSVMVVIYTLALFWIFYVVMAWSISRILEAFAVTTG